MPTQSASIRTGVYELMTRFGVRIAKREGFVKAQNPL